MGEFEDEYSAALEGEVRETRGALLNDTIGVLGPADPICLPETATVHEAVDTMLGRRQYGVLVTDAGGRPTGIFTERDDARAPSPAVRDQHAVLASAEHRVDRLVDSRRLGQADRIGGTEHADRVVQQRAPGLTDFAFERRRVFVLELTHGSTPFFPEQDLASILLPFPRGVPP